MKHNGRWLIVIVYAMAFIAFIQGAYGIQITASGGGAEGSGSVSMSFDLEKDAEVNGEISIDGADLRPATSISGKTKVFQQTHTAKDKSGKTASVFVKVANAPSDISYRSLILPEKVSKGKTAPWVSAEQFLSAGRADSITAKASASYGDLSTDAGIEMLKGQLPGDFVTLTGYHGKAYASDGSDSAVAFGVCALQRASEGSGGSLRIYNHANDGRGPLSINTNLNGESGLPATFRDLDASSFAGTETRLIKRAHVTGEFTSIAKSGTGTKTRTSNYGTENYLDMQAVKDSLPVGILGYYVNPSMATSSIGAIQGAVNAAQSSDAINVAAGTYKENVQIDKSLNVLGAGASDTIVDGQQAGSVFIIGKNDPNVDVILTGMTIQGGTGTPVEVAPGYANLYGGGILNYGTMKSKDSTISGNTAEFGGGILNYGTVTMAGGSITENTAEYNGGGILNYGTVTMNCGSITENTAAEFDGGGIANYGTVALNGGSITGNTAAHGGGIFNDGTVDLDGGSVTRNTAYSDGGGIYNTNYGTVNLNRGSISKNTANEYGGGIYSGYGTVNMAGGSITGNTAEYKGGGIFNDYGIVNLDGGSITENAATYSGGGIANLGTLTMNRGRISENTANTGGGICNHGTSNLDGGSVTKNTAYSNGGGICNYGTLNLDGSSVTGNTANEFGGGIYNGYGTLTLNRGSITGNTAQEGGGIDNYGGTVTMAGGSITGNTAKYNGGGILNYEGTLTMAGGSITGNAAENGGGIYNLFSTVTMNRGSITRNTATLDGGGIYNFFGTVDLDEGSISHNKASDGGGIYDIFGTLTGLDLVKNNAPNNIVQFV